MTDQTQTVLGLPAQQAREAFEHHRHQIVSRLTDLKIAFDAVAISATAQLAEDTKDRRICELEGALQALSSKKGPAVLEMMIAERDCRIRELERERDEWERMHTERVDAHSREAGERMSVESRLAQARADALEEAAHSIETDFGWQLPMFDDRRLNEVSDDAACAVQEQIVRFVRALARDTGTGGDGNG
jgi:hypothetical protein